MTALTKRANRHKRVLIIPESFYTALEAMSKFISGPDTKHFFPVVITKLFLRMVNTASVPAKPAAARIPHGEMGDAREDGGRTGAGPILIPESKMLRKLQIFRGVVTIHLGFHVRTDPA